MKQTSKRKKNIMLRAAAILLCLVMASLYLVTGLYAKYTTSDGNADGARVASFEIVTGGDFAVCNPFKVVMVPGETTTRKITVENLSEVTAKCTITAENETGNLPLQFSWKKGLLGGTVLAGPEKDTVTASEVLAIGSGQQTYTLEITWPSDYKASGYQREIDHIIVSIVCEQVD